MIEISRLLSDMVKREASDMHLRSGSPPVYRINGQLFRLKTENLSIDDVYSYIKQLSSEEQHQEYEKAHDVDFAYSAQGIGRFRINAFKQRGTPAMAVRLVNLDIPSFDSLRLPIVLKDLSLKQRGLILVTGATGSGKSTALASMINHINENIFSNIITIEDPIEYLHSDKKGLISQREVRQDTLSYDKAIRSAMRQDPDVILIGEIRDAKTMQIALSAADTGHLVFSTLHTMNAVESINRVLSFYPPHQQQGARLLLSSTLIAVASLRLLPQADGKSRVPATEILVNTAYVKELLQDPEKTGDIKKAMEEGYDQYGSQTFDQSILRLYSEGLINYEVASRYASNPEDFELRVKGIEGSSDRSWLGV